MLDVVDDNLLYRYTGYVVTNPSLQRSTDGGRIFVTIRRVKPPAAVSALTFVSRDVGYALDDGLLSTDGGGRTWTPVTLPG